MKPAIKSTEFWISLAALVMVNVSGMLANEQWANLILTVGNTLIAAGYTISRSTVKKADASNTKVSDSTSN